MDVSFQDLIEKFKIQEDIKKYVKNKQIGEFIYINDTFKFKNLRPEKTRPNSISTALNVVNSAAFSCACLNLFAIVCLSLDILILSS